MRKKRLSVRLPSELVDRLDAAARMQSRSRSNHVDHVLTLMLSVPVTAIGELEAPAPGSKSRLLSFRIPLASVGKLDRAAEASQRVRSDVVARLLAGSLALDLTAKIKALTPRRRGVSATDANIFA